MTHPLNTMTLKNDEYFTPPEIWERLAISRFDGDPSKFDLDPCTSKERPWDIARQNLDYPFCDGLKAKWWGRVWLNPPYDRQTGKWMEKLADHGQGTALIFARTDTQFFQEQVFGRADGILFLRGRICFCDVIGKQYESNAGAPSCLVAYGPADWVMLRTSQINGYRVELRK